jgi:uncharacterized damage-inducible protein DinB
MNIVLKSSIATLQKSINLLNALSDDTLSNTSIPPYYSCIGSHIRHILDFYDCILIGLPTNEVDLTSRKRDEKMHCDCNYASKNVSRVIKQMQALSLVDLHQTIEVYDDLGLGKTKIPYTLGSLLAQANSHAIHHYAIINYMLDRLGVQVNDESFGYNPTTPRSEVNLN